MLELEKIKSTYKQVISEKLQNKDGAGMKLAKRIEQLFKTRCNEFKKKYKLNFGVYFTPQNNQWAA